MTLDTQTLAEQVQHNCHISDARHGSDVGLCTYLMRMREYYRWEHALPYTATLDKDRVGDWLSEREELWDSVQQQDYRPIELAGECFDPFDANAINRHLHTQGLVYSAGLVHSGRPQFFLAELGAHEADAAGFELWIGQRELARGLHAPPAMTLGRSIFLRRESLRQLLWEKYESWLWTRPDNAMARALACYPFELDVDLALDRMVADEMRVIRAHEVGEYQVGRELGEAWEELLLGVLGTPAELMLRALRDHLADCLQTLPMLLEGDADEPSLHTFMGNLGNMRKEIFPALQPAYQEWLEGDRSGLAALVERGAGHWLDVARQALALQRPGEDRLAAKVIMLVEANKL